MIKSSLYFLLPSLIGFLIGCQSVAPLDYSKVDSLMVVHKKLEREYTPEMVIAPSSAEKEEELVRRLLKNDLDDVEEGIIIKTIEISKYQGKLNDILDRMLVGENCLWEQIRTHWSNSKEENKYEYGTLFHTVFSRSDVSQLNEKQAMALVNSSIKNYNGRIGLWMQGSFYGNITREKEGFSSGFRKAAIHILKDRVGKGSDVNRINVARSLMSWSAWQNTVCYPLMRHRFKRRKTKSFYSDSLVQSYDVEIENTYEKAITLTWKINDKEREEKERSGAVIDLESNKRQSLRASLSEKAEGQLIFESVRYSENLDDIECSETEVFDLISDSMDLWGQ